MLAPTERKPRNLFFFVGGGSNFISFKKLFLPFKKAAKQGDSNHGL